MSDTNRAAMVVKLTLSVTPEQAAALVCYCTKEANNADYWEAWENVIDKAFFVDASGVKWTLYTNSNTSDLLAISDKFTFED